MLFFNTVYVNFLLFLTFSSDDYIIAPTVSSDKCFKRTREGVYNQVRKLLTELYKIQENFKNDFRLGRGYTERTPRNMFAVEDGYGCSFKS